MNVLHICNDFAGSKVHSNLYKKLDEKITHQTIYTYFDGKEKVGNNRFISDKTDIIYDDILKPYIRKAYPFKIWWVYRHLIKNITPSDIDIVHATTLFSDGAVAYKLYKKYQIPYIVAIRATDLGHYIGRSRIIWPYGRQILLNASKVILINKTFITKLQELDFSRKIWEKIKNKIVVKPNGIDDYWVNNCLEENKINNYKVCYVGSFLPRKNIPRLISAVDLLKKTYDNIELNIMGGNGPDEELIVKMASERSYVNLYEFESDKTKICAFYRANSVFAMPSFNETFGLVYLEALSQKLPIIYSKGEGVDGMVENVGLSVDPSSVNDIYWGLKKILDNYATFMNNLRIDFSVFSWDNIAKDYVVMYNEAIKNRNKK